MTSMPEYDVIIAGAGLSSLTTAIELQRADLKVLVLEARDRVGGKTWSVDPLNRGKIVDVGAAWINDTTQSEVYALAEELGLELITQNTDGHVIQEDVDGGLSTFEYGGAPAHLGESDGVEEMLRVRQLFEDACQQIEITDVSKNDAFLDDMTLQDWVKAKSKSKTALASASVWTRAMLGLEPCEISALHFLNYCKSGGGLLQMRKDTKDGGQYLRFVNGTQSLSKGLASRLKPDTLHLSSPVTAISQSKPSNSGNNMITVTTLTSQGTETTFTSSHLILTLPTPLYKTITFTPPLPTAKSELSNRTVQGYTNKIMLLYDTPWWRRATPSLCGLLQSFTGPVTVTRDSSVESTSQYSLTCFLVGAIGRELSARPQAERLHAVKAHVRRVFQPFCAEIEEPIATAEYEWTKDRFSGGCPVPVMPPGVMTKYEKDLRSAFGHVHFAGTETAFEWKGYMDGAIRSGRRVAGEVVQALSRP